MTRDITVEPFVAESPQVLGRQLSLSKWDADGDDPFSSGSQWDEDGPAEQRDEDNDGSSRAGGKSF